MKCFEPLGEKSKSPASSRKMYRKRFGITNPGKQLFLTSRRLPLHLFQTFRNKRSDLMGRRLTVGECLIQRKVRQRQTRQRRLQVVARVDADGAVVDVNAVTAQAAAPRQKRRGGMAKDAGFAVIAFVEILVARPEQSV